MSKRNKSLKDIVYSTNPDWKKEDAEQSEVSSKNQTSVKQALKIYLVRLGGGKFMTCVTGFAGTKDEIEELGKFLKQKCGTGGSVKEGEILVQGDNRDKIVGILTSLGYSAKKAGG